MAEHGMPGASLWHELQGLAKTTVEQEKLIFKENYVYCDKHVANIVSKEVWILRIDVNGVLPPQNPRFSHIDFRLSESVNFK
jgi:hypothetical protein